MNLLSIFIPKKAQQVTELESHTVTWKVKSGWSNDTNKYHKVFLKKEEANEFAKQLRESADFINAWIIVSINKN